MGTNDMLTRGLGKDTGSVSSTGGQQDYVDSLLHHAWMLTSGRCVCICQSVCVCVTVFKDAPKIAHNLAYSRVSHFSTTKNRE